MRSGQWVRPVTTVTTAGHTSPPHARPLILWNLTRAVPRSPFQADMWNSGLYLSVYRRPKIGVEAVSVSCSSTSLVSGNLDKGPVGLRLVWDFVQLALHGLGAPARPVDLAECASLLRASLREQV